MIMITRLTHKNISAVLRHLLEGKLGQHSMKDGTSEGVTVETEKGYTIRFLREDHRLVCVLWARTPAGAEYDRMKDEPFEHGTTLLPHWMWVKITEMIFPPIAPPAEELKPLSKLLHEKGMPDFVQYPPPAENPTQLEEVLADLAFPALRHPARAVVMYCVCIPHPSLPGWIDVGPLCDEGPSPSGLEFPKRLLDYSKITDPAEAQSLCDQYNQYRVSRGGKP